MARRPFFSGNYGSALGSTANAANLIARAGEQRGQMMANMGAQIGGMIQQYGLNKEKRNKLTDKIESRIRLDPSIAQRITMTGDEDYDKKNVTALDKLSKGELGLKGLQGLDSAMATIKEIDLQKQQEETSALNRQLLQEQINTNKQKRISDNLLNQEKLKDISRKDRVYNSYIQQIKDIENKIKDGSRFNSLSHYEQYILGNKSQIINKTVDVDKLLYDPSAEIDLNIAKQNYQITADEEKRNKKEFEDIQASREVYSLEDQAESKKRADLLDIRGQKQKIKDSKNRNQIQPVLDASGTPVPGLLRMGNQLLQQDETGSVAKLGTAIENIQQVRTDKAEDVISLGKQRAEDFDITAKPIKPRIAAGGDLGGFFEDAMLYAGGLVGLSGKEMDEKIGDLGLGDREEQTARLTFVNAQIRPMLLRAVTSRGNVYSQKQIDTEILAGPKENNTAVEKKLREYPTLLENALTNAETVLRDPEIKPGTSVYEDARFIAMQVPTILRQIRSSMGMSGMDTMGTMGQSPSVDALLESLPRDTNRSRTDLDVTDILSQ